MKIFRYNTSGKWFKGNTHIHSIASDGGKTFAELAKMYAEKDYKFLFRTDHWVESNIKSDKKKYPLMWCDGIELDGHDSTGALYHVVCLGTLNGLNCSMGLEKGLKEVAKQGAIVILAHPAWCGNSLEDALRWQFDGVERYNHVCHWLNGKSDGSVYWENMLLKDPNTLSFAADDTHLNKAHKGWDGGWIVINSERLSRKNILNAIKTGNFYSSQGPEFKSIEFDGEKVKIKTSKIQFARIVGPAYNGHQMGDFSNANITEFEFKIDKEMPFVYIEIEDKNGKRAWTNNLFTN